jgi:hypothetical protein
VLYTRSVLLRAGHYPANFFFRDGRNHQGRCLKPSGKTFHDGYHQVIRPPQSEGNGHEIVIRLQGYQMCTWSTERNDEAIDYTPRPVRWMVFECLSLSYPYRPRGQTSCSCMCQTRGKWLKPNLAKYIQKCTEEDSEHNSMCQGKCPENTSVRDYCQMFSSSIYIARRNNDNYQATVRIVVVLYQLAVWDRPNNRYPKYKTHSMFR